MQTGKVFAAFDGASGGRRLAGLCEDMLAGQLLDWPRLREGYKGLAAAKVRNIPCEGFTLKAQWNPQRIVSTGASLDPAAIRARPCFLCRNNLPDAQRALDYRKHYLILCNPAPIFERHFTVANVQHRPQSIAPALDVFLTLIRDFSPEFQVFYNGPKSGASAPDHLHFQAAPAGVLPVEADIRAGQKMRLHKTMDGVELLEAAGMGRAIFVLKGPDSASVAAALLRVMAALRAVLNADGEPMMILLTDVAGVLDHQKQLINTMSDSDARRMIEAGVVEGGMFPKVKCCVKALRHGVRKAHIIDGRLKHAILLEMFTDSGIGTEIVLT
jgi:hypothetical protein